MSAEGAHLIDGIAFGKTYLKRPSRPSVFIPPRKRPRLIYDYAGEDDGYDKTVQSQPKQLRIQSAFDNADEEPGDEDEYYGDRALSEGSAEAPDPGRLRSGKRRKSVSFDESSLPATNEVPGEGDEDDDEEEDYEPERSDEDMDTDSDADDDENESNTLPPMHRSKIPPERSPNKTRRLVVGSVQKQSSTAGSSEDSSRKNTKPILLVSDPEEDDSASEASSTSMSSSSSISGSESDDSSSIFSQESSGSEPDTTSSRPSPIMDSTAAHADSSSKANRQNPRPSWPTVAPGQGRTKTKARNLRRKNLALLNHLKKTNQVDANMTLTAFKSASEGAEVQSQVMEEETPLTDSQMLDVPAVEIANASSQISAETAIGSQEGEASDDFERRRQKLLDSVMNGGVDVDSPEYDHSLGSRRKGKDTSIPLPTLQSTMSGRHDDKSTVVESNKVNKPVASSASSTKAAETHFNVVAEQDEDTPMTTGDATTSQSELQTSPESRRKSRSKLDLASSNRLIFGSLGVRTPRNKADQDALRAKLSDKKRGNVIGLESAKPKLVEPMQSEVVTSQPLEKDINAWKLKIKLSAVECFDEAVVLSTPPFPFKQRWDPQQRPTGKKRKRSSQFQADEDVVTQEESFGPGLNYDDNVDDLQQTMGLIHDSQGEDLPSLPAVMETLTELEMTDVRVGAVIAFKQLLVSQATKWAPLLSAYQTALVTDVDTEFDLLTLQLAKRDIPDAPYEYDTNGNRVYGKFEVPTEDEGDVIDGRLELTFIELIEPKLIRAAPQQLPANPIVPAESQVIHVPESLVDQFTQESLFTKPGEAGTDGAIEHESGLKRSGHSSEASTTTSTLKGNAASTSIKSSAQRTTTTPQESEKAAQAGLSSNGETTSRTLKYKDLPVDETQRSATSFDSAAEPDGQSGAKGGLLEASA